MADGATAPDIVLRSHAKHGVSKDGPSLLASWFETRRTALLTMKALVPYGGAR
jgi:hypothetical protein